MRNEIILSLIIKAVEDRLDQKLADIPISNTRRGPRGPEGPAGKDFNFDDHKEEIKSWVKEATIKFENLTEEQLDKLRGPIGKSGKDGKDGQDGKSFLFEENREQIKSIITDYFSEIKTDLKLKFSDLSQDEIEALRGPRGQRGKAGKDFNFEDHREFFESLKLKFTDLTKDEIESLKLKFQDLEESDIEKLKLKFSDLTDEEIERIRGPRGQRGKAGLNGVDGKDGQNGIDGKDGKDGLRGPRGPIGYGLPGPVGPQGRDGIDGKDAPTVSDIQVEKINNSFYLVFTFSDGSTIETNLFKIGGSTNYILGGGGSQGTTGGGGTGPQGPAGLSAYEVAVSNGFVGTEQDWLDSLVGPQGPQGPQGPAGPSGSGGTQLLENISCDSTVYVGSIVRLTQQGATEAKIADWTLLSMVTQLNYTDYSVVAVNAKADGYQSANAIGVVSNKPTSTTCDIITAGPTPELFISLDVQKEYYLSADIDGRIVASFDVPTAAGKVYLKVGKPVSSKKLYVNIGERIVRT